jgi:hypothetical protein
MKYSYIIFFFTLFFPSLLNAQDLSFVNYSTREGMSSAQVYQMFQDVNGDMLFATDRGITKYDGYEFETYDLSDGLTNTTVFKFFSQSNGDVWCSTIDNSWFYFKNGTTEFEACELNPLIQEASMGAQVEDLWIDINGDMCFGFESFAGFLKINRKLKRVEHPLKTVQNDYDSVAAVFVKTNDWFTYTQTTNQQTFNWGIREKIVIQKSRKDIGFKKIESINEHFLFSSGRDLIIMNHGLSKINLKFDSRILGIGKFDDSHFWLSLMKGGIKIFDMFGKETNQWLHGTSPTFLFSDANGGIWVSTLNNGVYYAQSDNLNCYNLLSTKFIYSISPGKGNNPLISTFDNHYQFDGESLKIISFDDNQEEHNGAARKAIYNSVTNKYLQVLKGTVIKRMNLPPSDAAIIDFSENTNLPLLIASPYSILELSSNLFDFKKSSTRITAIEYANNGYLVGGYNDLQFFNSTTSKFEPIEHEELKGRISDIKLKGKFHYIGTNGAGLIKYDQKEDNVIQVLKKDGLASNLINEVFAESESVVWVATNVGLDRVTFQGNQFVIKHFGIEHGLIDNDVTDVYVYNGIIWIGTRTGLCSISKKEFDASNIPVSIKLFWEQVLAENKVLSKSSNIILKYDQNNLELNFHSAFYGGVSRVKYRYKLSGTDDSWHSLKNRTIVLNRLPPGEYNVILQANVDNTNWTDNQIEANFTILPPFYKTWWFRSLIIVIISLLIYLFFRFRVLIYNRSLVKEVLRLVIRKINPQIKSFVIQEQGKSHRINSMDILYLKSDGNYLTIQLKNSKFTVRHKIGDFADLVPDRLEYLRVHKSYVVRKDKITGRNVDTIYLNDIEIPLSRVYKKLLKDLTV